VVRRAVLLAGLLAAAPAAAQDGPTTPDEAGDLVDRVVAVVAAAPITASAVALETAIRERVAGSTDPSEFGRLLTEAVDPLEALVFKTLLLARPETRNVELSGFQAEQRLRRFEETFESRQEAIRWRVDHGIEKSALLDWFEESVLLDAVVDLSVQVAITEEDQRQYYDRHKDAVYGGRPFEEVRNDVAERVYNLRFEDEYNSWRKALRSSVQLRYIAR